MSSCTNNNDPQDQNPLPQLRFHPGQFVGTRGALALLKSIGVDPQALLQRHLGGDWGNVSSEDAQANEEALSQWSRILSVYQFPSVAQAHKTSADSPLRVWLITEADRRVTTLLLPEEY
ncbi:type I restriction endonuclease subunit M [Methylomonas sp. HYX-M1]|uniref:type I restriction endonuclease subunit M n=1 Tax=Methylomonas sp. HYX-M1 TaxID=3139307 RepID=UPI00345BE29E